MTFRSLFLGGFASLLCISTADWKKAAVDYVDPTIGNVVPYLVPNRMNVHQPNQMLRMFPMQSDYLSDQINYFPLQVMHARGKGILQMRVSSGEIQTGSFKRPMSFDHDLQVPHPWYYENHLIDDDITIRFAPGKKAGIYRIDFPKGQQKNLLITGGSELSTQASGPSGFALEETVTFISRNNPARAPSSMSVWCYGQWTDLAGQPVTETQIQSDKGRISLSAGPTTSESVYFKYALSYVSAEQAKRNYEAEVARKDLTTLSSEAKLAWENCLNRIQVKGGSTAQKRTFYTALYRSHERMVDITEDGKYYSGFDEKVHETDRRFYTDDGIWDTYRALHPLRVLLDPKQEEDMLHSFVEMSRQAGGWMPTYARATGHRPCMVGYHSSAMFLDAYRKGLNFDIEAAYSGIRKNLTEGSWIAWRQWAPRTKLDQQMETLGYLPALHPGEKETEPLVDSFERRQAVAVTLGRSYDNWALSEFAKELGKDADHKKFAAISQQYKTLWHPQHRLYMPKDAQGNWIDINPKLDGGRGFRDYYDENNGWTYAWYMHHDIPGLKSLLGGNGAMAARLDQLFREPLGIRKGDWGVNGSNSTGMVGQFSMGNEPSLHIPYLYNECGQPWKTQQRTRFLLDVWFKDDIFGTPGDDDGGSITPWAVFTSMGFYPALPGTPVYSLTSPVFTEVTINLQNGKTFKISAPASSKRNKYIQSAKLNGKPLDIPFITHQQIISGGELALELGAKPNKHWGVAHAAAVKKTSY